MIDYFSLALTHGLIALALWRLLLRDDLDNETPAAPSGSVEDPAARPDA